MDDPLAAQDLGDRLELQVAPRRLAPGGSLVLKLLESPEAQSVARRLRAAFDSARVTGLRATRARGSERYLVARGYRPRVSDS